jgi:putative phosphotransacetylase
MTGLNDKELIDIITRRIVAHINSGNTDISELECVACVDQSCPPQQRLCDVETNLNRVPVGVSARHIHISQEHLEILYGKGHQLTVYAALYQPGAFAAKEVLTLVGPRMRAIENVRILGPTRNYTQVELAKTDAIRLGIDPPICSSGDLKGASPVVLIGPAGSVHLKEGAIRATRHIHMNPAEADRLEIKSDDVLKVRVPGERALVFENVLPKIKEGVVLQMHIDTDDANAADLRGGESVEIIKSGT